MLSTLTARAYDAQINGIYYNLVAKAKQAIVTSGDFNYNGTVIIPNTIEYEDVSYSVIAIGSSAFSGCYQLTSVTIPNSVTSIGDRAFASCSALTSLTIPNSVTSIGSSAFHSCQKLTSVTIGSGVTSIGEGSFMYCSSLTSVTIPNSVTSIGKEAFSSCSSLTSVTIGNSVTSIGYSAFYYCSSLKSINIPNSVTSIGGSAFHSCRSLTSMKIPNSVTSLGSFIFTYCSGLTSVTIPNSVTSIGEATFMYCSGLTSVTIGSGVTSIGERAFLGCSGLTSVKIPNSVTSIGGNAFYDCSSLKSVTIGSSINNIGGYMSMYPGKAFANCPQLTDVYCYTENVPSTSSDTFDGSYVEYATLYVPEASIANYKATAPWSGFGTIKTLSGEIPVTPKCATPTISYADGKVTFSCETEDVEFVTKVTSSDSGDYEGASVSFSNQYTVSVYATKDGYDNSDVATKEITVVIGGTSGIRGDANIDGEIGMADIMFIVQHILTGKFPDEDESASLSCPDGNHPHMIDLGMPSGTKWACCNVGTSKPEGYGNYYACGEVEPKSQYDFDHYIGFSYDELLSGIGDIYGTEKDVAHVKWGDKWRIPTYSEIYELRNNCTYTEITYNGVKGMKFAGKNGNSIFLPAAGRYEGDKLVDNGVTGHYWQGSVNDDGTQTGEVPYYDLNQMVWGLTIRPVYVNSTTR